MYYQEVGSVLWKEKGYSSSPFATILRYKLDICDEFVSACEGVVLNVSICFRGCSVYVTVLSFPLNCSRPLDDA